MYPTIAEAELPHCSEIIELGNWKISAYSAGYEISLTAEVLDDEIRTVELKRRNDTGDFISIWASDKTKEFDGQTFRIELVAGAEREEHLVDAEIHTAAIDARLALPESVALQAWLQRLSNDGDDDGITITTFYEGEPIARLTIGHVELERALARASSRQEFWAAQLARRKCRDGCFITTATCEALGRPDDCFELRSLRQFRDRHMMATLAGRKQVREYYELAPQILASIDNSESARSLGWIYFKYVLPSALLAALRCDRRAEDIYQLMMRRLKRRYL